MPAFFWGCIVVADSVAGAGFAVASLTAGLGGGRGFLSLPINMFRKGGQSTAIASQRKPSPHFQVI
jgi:hypothetical protein